MSLRTRQGQAPGPDEGPGWLPAALAVANQLDATNPLAHLRERFVLPEGLVYLDGNSLGPLPAHVPAVVADLLTRQWGHDLIASWDSNDWWTAPLRVGARVSALIGAQPEEVLATDSVSVNLHKLIPAAVALRPGRGSIVVEPGSFPTDLYVADAVAAARGLRVLRVGPDRLAEQIDDDVALVVYNQVDYRTGRAYDVAELTRVAHRAGALMLWDLSHSAGVLPVDFDTHEIDFAVGCGYKYLNGGPGAPGFVVAAERHLEDLPVPLAGWHGHARPFAMQDGFVPAPGIGRLRVGSPPIISLLTLQAALDVYDDLDVAELRRASLSLTGLFLDLAVELLVPRGLQVLTPAEPQRRGSQVSLAHPQASAVVRALTARSVVGDFREPDIVRLGFAPLYVTHADVVRAVQALIAVVDGAEHEDPRFARPRTEG